MINVRINSFQIFREVSNDIYSKIDKNNPIKTFDYLIAFVVNCSLSCELGLKAIHSLKYKEYKSHSLSDLFNNLSLDQKQFIKVNMPSLIDKSENSIEFQTLIEKVTNNFVDWRYFYEKNQQTNWLFLYELMESINIYLTTDSTD